MKNDPKHAIRRFSRKSAQNRTINQSLEILNTVADRLFDLEVFVETLIRAGKSDGSIELPEDPNEPISIVPKGWTANSCVQLYQACLLIESLRDNPEKS